MAQPEKRGRGRPRLSEIEFLQRSLEKRAGKQVTSPEEKAKLTLRAKRRYKQLHPEARTLDDRMNETFSRIYDQLEIRFEEMEFATVEQLVDFRVHHIIKHIRPDLGLETSEKSSCE